METKYLNENWRSLKNVTVTEKKLRAFNSGKFWDAVCNMAFQKMKMQLCITKKPLVMWSWNFVRRKFASITKISQIFESGNSKMNP